MIFECGVKSLSLLPIRVACVACACVGVGVVIYRYTSHIDTGIRLILILNKL